jgi:hypothetical protein
MFTLLARYLAKPTIANASRVAHYHRKHQFAELLLGPLERAILVEALESYPIIDFTKKVV